MKRSDILYIAVALLALTALFLLSQNDSTVAAQSPWLPLIIKEWGA